MVCLTPEVTEVIDGRRCDNNDTIMHTYRYRVLIFFPFGRSEYKGFHLFHT